MSHTVDGWTHATWVDDGKRGRMWANGRPTETPANPNLWSGDVTDCRMYNRRLATDEVARIAGIDPTRMSAPAPSRWNLLARAWRCFVARWNGEV